MKLSTSIEPASRKAAFAMIENSFKSGEHLQPGELEALYKYFMPALPKAVKRDWQWVSRVAASKDVRYYLKTLYSNGSRLMATDSHRLHIIPSNMPAGYYHPKTLDPMDEAAKYPDVDRIINGRSDFEPLHHYPMDETKTHEKMLLVKVGPVWVQSAYMLAALNGRDDWQISVQENSAIIGQNDDGWQFAVMPMRT